MEAFPIEGFIGQRMAFLRKPKTFSLFTERQRNSTNLFGNTCFIEFYQGRIYLDLLNSVKV